MLSNPKREVTVGSVEYATMHDFAELSLLWGSKVVGWMEGIYTNFEVRMDARPSEACVILQVPHVLYSPGPYHGYILVKDQTREHALVDRFTTWHKGVPYDYTIKVMKRELSPNDDIGTDVLKLIKEKEEFRNKSRS
jgi:hypothetical protein